MVDKRRRDFITLLGGAAAAWPLAARRQQSNRTRHIAILMSGAEGDPETQARLAGIRQGLSRFGWSEGRDVEITYRYASASAEQAPPPLVTCRLLDGRHRFSCRSRMSFAFLHCYGQCAVRFKPGSFHLWSER